MKVLYLDIFSGISGDMFLGALLDLGVSERALRRELGKLHLHGWSLRVQRAVQSGIRGVRFQVDVGESRALKHSHAGHGAHRHPAHEHRSFAAIQRLIQSSGLDARTKTRALSIFRRIAGAEGKIHGVPVRNVHFHEVGAVDSIVDIVGAAIAMRELGAEKVCAREVEDGTGFVEMEHGRFPVPVPAVLEILRGVKIRQCDEPTEIVTPTGAAILAEFVESYGPMPGMEIEKVGYGLGTRQLKTRPNVLRAVLGHSTAPSLRRLGTPALGHSNTQALKHSGTVVSVLETNIDDMNPELFGDVMDRLFAAGARDVFYTPIQMKKNRPGTLLTVLADPERAELLVELLLQHTTTFGVRVTEARRQVLDRETRTVKTRFGPVQVKIGKRAGQVVSIAPEYESCRKVAHRRNVPLKLVYAEAQRMIARNL
jgi:uncharacterized protein (TIGR00299 family) protein